MSDKMDIFFQEDLARTWKANIKNLVDQLEIVLQAIEKKVKEVGEQDSITKRWEETGEKVQTAFDKLINCALTIISVIDNIFTRFAQTMSEINESHDKSQGRLYNT